MSAWLKVRPNPADNLIKRHMTRPMTFAEVRDLLDRHGLVYEDKSIYRFLAKRVRLGLIAKQGEHGSSRYVLVRR